MTHPQKTAEIAELRQALDAARTGHDREITPDQEQLLSAALDELERLREEIPRLHAAGSRLANAVQYRRLQLTADGNGNVVLIPRKYIDEALADCPFEVKT